MPRTGTLRDDGRFVYSIKQWTWPRYRLGTTGRYQRTVDGLATCGCETELVSESCGEANLRLPLGRPDRATLRSCSERRALRCQITARHLNLAPAISGSCLAMRTNQRGESQGNGRRAAVDLMAIEGRVHFGDLQAPEKRTVSTTRYNKVPIEPRLNAINRPTAAAGWR